MNFKYLICVLPLAFFFSFIEIEVSSFTAFTIVLLLVLFTAYTSQTLKKRYMLAWKLVGVGLSVMFAKLFIVAPNESWFNPFTMETVMVLSEVVIFFFILLCRCFIKIIIHQSN